MLQETTSLSLHESATHSHGPIPNKDFSGIKSMFSDYLGLSGSFLCIVHCVGPQLLILGSLSAGLGSFFSSGLWHIFFWVTCLLAVYQSTRISEFPAVKRVLWVSFLVFTLGLFLDIAFGVETIISYLGSASLVFAHGYNLYKIQRSNSKVSCAS